MAEEKLQMEDQMIDFEHFEHQSAHRRCLPTTSEGIHAAKMERLHIYHKDPTNPQPYHTDKRKFGRIIQEKLKMNENLITTPEDERYHNALRTAAQDLSSVNETHRIKDWDAKVSPTKYKAFKNCEPGRHGAPYDYREYLPALEA